MTDRQAPWELYSEKSGEKSSQDPWETYAQGSPANQAPQAAPQAADMSFADKFQAFGQTAAQGGSAGFADDIGAVLAMPPVYAFQILTGNGWDPTDAWSIIQKVKRGHNQGIKQFAEEHPKTALAAEVVPAMASGYAGAKTFGAKFPGAYDDIARFIQNRKIIGGSAAAIPSAQIYGMGVSEGYPHERAVQAVPYIPPAMLGGVFGNYLAGGASKLSKSVGDWLNAIKSSRSQKMAAQQSDRVFTQAPGDITVSTGDDVFKSTDQSLGILDDMEYPLTKAQRTQNVGLMAAEDQAEKLGDQTVLASRTQQQEVMRKPFQHFDDIGDTATQESMTFTRVNPEDFGEKAAETVTDTWKVLKKAADKEYKILDEMGDAYFEPGAVNQIFIKRLNKDLVDANLRPGDFPALESEIERITDIVQGEGTTAVKFEALRMFKEKLNQLNPNNLGITPAAGRRMLKIAGDRFEEATEELGKMALISGDPEIIKQFWTSRQAASKYLKIEKNDLLKKLFQQNDLSNVQLANVLMAGSSRNQKIGQIVQDALKVLPDDASREQFRVNLRNGYLARALRNGIEKNYDQLKAQRGIKVAKLNANNIRKELQQQMRDKTLWENVYTMDEQKALMQYMDWLGSLSSDQLGAKNFSNTTIAFMRLLQGGFNLPVIKHIPAAGVISQGFENQIQRETTKAAQKSVEEVFDGMYKMLSGNRNDYSMLAPLFGGTTAIASDKELTE